MTNMRNGQTCSIGYLNLISAGVLLFGSEALQVACDVVSCPCIHIPIWVDSIPMSCCDCLFDSIFCLIGLIKAMPALEIIMIRLVADLTEFTIVGASVLGSCWCSVRPASIASTTIASATPSAGMTKAATTTPWAPPCSIRQ
jgi:hypothetical protein